MSTSIVHLCLTVSIGWPSCSGRLGLMAPCLLSSGAVGFDGPVSPVQVIVCGRVWWPRVSCSGRRVRWPRVSCLGRRVRSGLTAPCLLFRSSCAVGFDGPVSPVQVVGCGRVWRPRVSCSGRRVRSGLTAPCLLFRSSGAVGFDGPVSPVQVVGCGRVWRPRVSCSGRRVRSGLMAPCLLFRSSCAVGFDGPVSPVQVIVCGRVWWPRVSCSGRRVQPGLTMRSARSLPSRSSSRWWGWRRMWICSCCRSGSSPSSSSRWAAPLHPLLVYRPSVWQCINCVIFIGYCHGQPIQQPI